jgi:Xaa-Pro dipeptidase
MTSTVNEADRIEQLLAAQAKAEELFSAALAQGLVRPGISESTISDGVRDLANEMFDVRRYWHKRLVRSGPNTLAPYKDNPPDRVLGDDDIMILDLGPIFEGWEADLGRTIVFGKDTTKLEIAAHADRVWAAGRDYFRTRPDITGSELYHFVLEQIEGAGYGHGIGFAGHLVGEFPHEALNFPEGSATPEEMACYIAAENHLPMRRVDSRGRPCHWILEVFVVHEENGYGAFTEQLLDI